MARENKKREPNWTPLVEVATSPSATGQFEISYRIIRANDNNALMVDIRKRNGDVWMQGVTIPIEEIDVLAEVFTNIANARKQEANNGKGK